MNPPKSIGVPAAAGVWAVVAVLLIGNSVRAADQSEMQVLGGTVKFTAATNIFALTVHGQSNQMTASLRLRKDTSGVELENVHARIDPKTFTTGMSLRDQHLRKKVFSLENDSMPELQFLSDKIACPELPAGRNTVCPASGQLTLRGVARPFTINLSVTNDGRGYRISGTGVVKLSAYGIEPPCQLGVCVTDEVKLNLEFQAKENRASSAGGNE
jgi:polyisoprenoid-binding protein YceI